jgi:hypothetical protein
MQGSLIEGRPIGGLEVITKLQIRHIGLAVNSVSIGTKCAASSQHMMSSFTADVAQPCTLWRTSQWL